MRRLFFPVFLLRSSGGSVGERLELGAFPGKIGFIGREIVHEDDDLFLAFRSYRRK